MKVTICEANYKHAPYYLSMARELGYIPFEQDQDYKVNVLMDGYAWRDPQSVYTAFGEGIHTFEFEQGKLVTRRTVQIAN